MSADPAARAAALPCWSGRVELEPLGGGITNTNFVGRDGGKRYVVRIGDDIPVHGVMRFNELAASRAAGAAGISPEVVYAEPGAMVLRFVDGKTFAEEDVRKDENLRRIVPLVRRCHFEIPKHFRGPGLVFWVFQVIRDYAETLKEGNHRLKDELPRLVAVGEQLEGTVGAIRIIFGHNDLLAANFIDDGDRLWLVDWDYAGYNSGLFDLGGLASNSQLSGDQEKWLLETYFEAPVTDDLWRRYNAMKCASLLREAMWSMVSEIHLRLDFDYVAYTTENLARFERAYAQVKELKG
ncbi:MAG: choline/ethanolamine kinase family protein [Alphaproteobacteria bacterium]